MNTFIKYVVAVFHTLSSTHWMPKIHELIIQIVALIFLLCESINMIYQMVEPTITLIFSIK